MPASATVYGLTLAVIAGGNQIHVIRLRFVRFVAKYIRFNQVDPNVIAMSFTFAQLDVVVAGFVLNAVNGFLVLFVLCILLFITQNKDRAVNLQFFIHLEVSVMTILLGLKQTRVPVVKVYDKAPVV